MRQMGNLNQITSDLSNFKFQNLVTYIDISKMLSRIMGYNNNNVVQCNILVYQNILLSGKLAIRAKFGPRLCSHAWCDLKISFLDFFAWLVNRHVKTMINRRKQYHTILQDKFTLGKIHNPVFDIASQFNAVLLKKKITSANDWGAYFIEYVLEY